MTEPMSDGSQYLQRLIRQCAASPAVTAAFVIGGQDRFAELDLYLAAPAGLPGPWEDWLAPLGETASTGVSEHGAELVTTDGLTIRVAVNQPVPPDAQPLFDRGAAAPGPGAPGPEAPAPGAPAPVLPYLAAAAAGFWRNLYGAAAAIGRGQPLTAHGRLEPCRTALVDLYRLALAPGPGPAGWEGADGPLLGAGKAIAGLQDWLVTPLDLRAQWRCACRLAESYEQLMLPLAERLHLTYPWTIRNLTFRRLDEIRPDRPEAPSEKIPRLKDTETGRQAAGPAKVKVKIRRPGAQEPPAKP